MVYTGNPVMRVHLSGSLNYIFASQLVLEMWHVGALFECPLISSLTASNTVMPIEANCFMPSHAGKTAWKTPFLYNVNDPVIYCFEVTALFIFVAKISTVLGDMIQN